jgi:hypothetical protein
VKRQVRRRAFGRGRCGIALVSKRDLQPQQGCEPIHRILSNGIYGFGKFKGVLAINDTNSKGSSLKVIGQESGDKGYLNIWNDVSYKTDLSAFGVVHIRGLRGEYIRTEVYGYHPDTYSKTVISEKYSKTCRELHQSFQRV